MSDNGGKHNDREVLHLCLGIYIVKCFSHDVNLLREGLLSNLGPLICFPILMSVNLIHVNSKMKIKYCLN